MSRATKRKHVVRELLEERVRPADRQTIVRVLGTPGNNLHEVETPEGTRFLVSMPPRFRKHVWIKRGDGDNDTPVSPRHPPLSPRPLPPPIQNGSGSMEVTVTMTMTPCHPPCHPCPLQ
ncbi:probable RNA-binding protein EIF1AD [Columba livia]|uniref:probable RNA-binding protein EIF1AD n=1 Tax=Columba livia TaxID=8932 RepID=UPI0031BB5575